MELIIKAAAAALTAGLVGLLIKRSNPELSLALSACTVALILIGAMGFAKGILELSEAVKTIAGGSAKFISPVLKCVAVAIVTKLASELCREASQSAAASAVELAGTLCAFSVALPLIMSMLKMIGGMV